MKKVLITGANSAIAKEFIKLIEDEYEPILAARSDIERKNEKFRHFKLDIQDLESIKNVAQSLKDEKLYAVVNFAGVAISSPIEFLDENQLKKQLDICLLGLLRLIQNFKNNLSVEGRIINISSMAAFGIFPFISPYCISKAAGDILLNLFETETGIKTVSVKPGVVKTPFWDASVRINEENFKSFKGIYEKTGDFLIKNARNNALSGLEPYAVAKLIFKALRANNPKKSYTIGFDAKIAQLASTLPKNILNFLVRTYLKIRTDKL